MKPQIRVATNADGNIEAATFDGHRLLVDCRFRNVIESNVAVGTDMFRWLVRAAREHCAI